MPAGRWLLPIGVGQVAVWQLAAVAVLVTAFPADVGTVPVIAVAVLVVLVSSVRFGGLCGYEWAIVYVRYRMRKPVAAPTPMLALLPSLYVHTHFDRAGNRVGVASVDENVDYSVTIRLAPSARPAPQALLALLHKSFDSQVSSVQLVVRAVAASPAPIRVHWLALRYRSDVHPLAALARGGGQEGGRRTAAAAALRLVGELADAGYPSVVLDTLELHQDLLVVAGADPEAFHGPRPTRMTESWRDWSIGRLRQVCFVPRNPADATALVGRYAPGSTFTCSSYSLTRTARGHVRSRAAVRIGVSREEFWLSPEKVTARLGVPLKAANGRHGEHVLATLPLAAG